jgi:hypothetical protein
MDRRRFVPAPEGLEDRKLMAGSLFNPGGVFGSSNNFYNIPSALVTAPNTPGQKAARIDHLPFYMKQTQPGRFLPKSLVQPIQADLQAIEGKLHSPPSAVLTLFNHEIRHTVPQQNLSPQNAQRLNQDFGDVLEAAGAAPEVQAQFQADMNTLAKVDALDVNPVILATNDYSVVIQTALGVGRPIRTPDAPALSPRNAIGGNGSHLTSSRSPAFVGRYDPAATIDLIDVSTGRVLGTTTSGPGGRYSVTPTSFFSYGDHTVAVQAFEEGFASAVSPSFTFRIAAHPGQATVQTTAWVPQGPLGATTAGK